MVLITDKNNVVLDWSESMDHMPYSGYPRLVEKDTCYPSELVEVYAVEEIPEEVEAQRFCFTLEEGFYPNPDYREPDPFDSPEYAAGYEQALLDLMELELEEE